MVPGVVELGDEEYLLPRNARVLDSFANLLLVAVCKGRVDMTVAFLQCYLDSCANLSNSQFYLCILNLWWVPHLGVTARCRGQGQEYWLQC